MAYCLCDLMPTWVRRIININIIMDIIWSRPSNVYHSVPTPLFSSFGIQDDPVVLVMGSNPAQTYICGMFPEIIGSESYVSGMNGTEAE